MSGLTRRRSFFVKPFCALKCSLCGVSITANCIVKSNQVNFPAAGCGKSGLEKLQKQNSIAPAVEWGGSPMNVRKWTKNANHRMRKKLLEADADFRAFHSRSYHKHFEGYTEFRRLDGNGRMRLVREYMGAWYRQDLSSVSYVSVRILFVLLLGIQVYLMAALGMMHRASDTAWYTTITELATILSMVGQAYILFVNYLFAPRDMTVGDYKSASLALKRTASITAVCFIADMLSTLFYIALHRSTVSWMDGTAEGIFLLEAVISAAIVLVERKVPYRVREGKKETETDGVEIEA